MCKEMQVIPVNRVLGTKRIIRKNGGLRRHKGSLTKNYVFGLMASKSTQKLYS
jgi:hypothetical protein